MAADISRDIRAHMTARSFAVTSKLASPFWARPTSQSLAAPVRVRPWRPPPCTIHGTSIESLGYRAAALLRRSPPASYLQPTRPMRAGRSAAPPLGADLLASSRHADA